MNKNPSKQPKPVCILSEKKINKLLLPEEIWNFPKWFSRLGEEDEALACLNYEYARSAKFIVTEVEKLHHSQRRSPEYRAAPAFARFLHEHCPQFPEKEWPKIPADTRQKMMNWSFKPPVESSIGKTPPVLFGLGFEEFLPKLVHQIKAIQASDDERDEYFQNDDYAWTPCELPELAVLRLNWKCEDAVIVKEFANWLQQRRAGLIEKAENTNNDAKNEAKAVDQAKRKFIPGRAKLKKGAGSSLRQYHSSLKALGALRILTHYENNWETYLKLHDEGKTGGAKPLYPEERAGTRAADQAREVMKRFLVAWQRSDGFTDVHRRRNPIGLFDQARILAQPLWLISKKTKKQSKKKDRPSKRKKKLLEEQRRRRRDAIKALSVELAGEVIVPPFTQSTLPSGLHPTNEVASDLKRPGSN